MIGCGASTESTGLAAPQTVEIGWRELDGRAGVGFLLEIRRLHVTESGWRVDARVVNRTPVHWFVRRPHVRGGTKFGLFVGPREAELRPEAAPSLIATEFDPPLPRLLEPGAAWSGRLSGQGRIPRGSYVRFVFGRFDTTELPPVGLPAQLLAVTSRSIRVS